MARTETLLQAVCTSAGVGPEELAVWARVDPTRVRSALSGGVRLSTSELDGCARVFGLRLDDLLAGEQGRAPMTLNLRATTGGSLDLRGALSLELQDLLGDLQRLVRDIDELERVLRVRRPALPSVSVRRAPTQLHEGDLRARAARDALGLDDGPIASMRALVEGCGIAVVWVTTDQVDRGIDGACVLVPRPAILVNLLEEGNAYPWRVRTTLAHELCHLLFDLDGDRGRALVSPAKARDPRLEEIERTARAFGPCFLAPTEGVRKLVAGLDPSSEDAIVAVGVTYGVGRTVAINRLQHIFGLSPEQRAAMEGRAGQVYQGNFAEDQAPLHTGFRGEPLRGLVERALETDLINPGRARTLLGLPATETLPFPRLGPDLCRPTVTPEEHMAQLATRHLLAHYEGRFAGDAVRVDNGWRVQVFQGPIGGRAAVQCGHLLMSAAGIVEGEHWSPDSLA